MAFTNPNAYTNKCFNDNREYDYEESVSSSDFQRDSVIYDVLSESVHQKQDSPNLGTDEVIFRRNKTNEENISVPEKVRKTRFPVRIVLLICLIVFINIITGISTYFIVKSSESMKNADDGQQCSLTPWSSWTLCSTTCGNGTSFRLKQRSGDKTHCSMKDVIDTRQCNLSDCSDKVDCFWTLWSSWTPCCTTCTCGIRYRVKQYLGVGNDDKCTRQENRETKNCTNNCTGSTEIIDMKLNTSTLYKLMYTSNDGTTLSNVYTLETPNSPDGTFENYKGASASLCIRQGERFYYEVEYDYEVIGIDSIQWLIFEIGLAELSKADNHYYVAVNSVNGWSFNTYKSNSYTAVALQAKHNDHSYKNERFDSSSVGTKKRGILGAFVDRLNNRFSLIYNSNIFYTFEGVVSATDLCPMFGVYNPSTVRVQLRVMKSRNFTDYPLFTLV